MCPYRGIHFNSRHYLYVTRLAYHACWHRAHLLDYHCLNDSSWLCCYIDMWLTWLRYSSIWDWAWCYSCITHMRLGCSVCRLTWRLSGKWSLTWRLSGKWRLTWRLSGIWRLAMSFRIRWLAMSFRIWWLAWRFNRVWWRVIWTRPDSSWNNKECLNINYVYLISTLDS